GVDVSHVKTNLGLGALLVPFLPCDAMQNKNSVVRKVFHRFKVVLGAGTHLSPIISGSHFFKREGRSCEVSIRGFPSPASEFSSPRSRASISRLIRPRRT